MLLFVLTATSLAAQSIVPMVGSGNVAVDSQGSFYFAGSTSSTSLGTPGVIQPTPPPAAGRNPIQHGYVAKLAPSGDRIEWATYLTGSQSDAVTSIAIASDGTLYVAGSTTSTTLFAPLASQSSANHGLFVARLTADGTTLLAGVSFGSGDPIVKLQLDPSGNVYVAGTTGSTDFPTTPGAYQRTYGNASSVTCTGGNQFVAKFDPGLKNLLFSTYIGTTGHEKTGDFTLGPDGSMYIAGTDGQERACETSAILTRLNPQGTAALFSGHFTSLPTTYGAYALAVDSTGTAYVLGDNRAWSGGTSAPVSTLWKVDPLGKLVIQTTIHGKTYGATVSGAEVAIFGPAWPSSLAPTGGGTGACLQPSYFGSEEATYEAFVNRSTLAVDYAGFVPGVLAFATPNQVVINSILGYSLRPTGPPAPGTVTCAVNAASYDSSQLAPGELTSIFGVSIGPPSATSAQPDSNGTFPTQLAGITLTANGIPAPLLYAAPNQINFIVPFSVSGSAVHFELRRNGTLLSTFVQVLAPQEAGAFTAGTPSVSPLAALNQDGSLNSASNPAAPGSIVTIFVTGMGAMVPALPDGSSPSLPANVPALQPEVAVETQAAEVLYMGNAPTLVQGVVQINFRLPNPLPNSAIAGQRNIRLFYPYLGGNFTLGTVFTQ